MWTPRRGDFDTTNAVGAVSAVSATGVTSTSVLKLKLKLNQNQKVKLKVEVEVEVVVQVLQTWTLWQCRPQCRPQCPVFGRLATAVGLRPPEACLTMAMQFSTVSPTRPHWRLCWPRSRSL
jgi:hypothetical protein